MSDRRENPLDQIEAAAFSLILQRLMVRGRLALEMDLKELEHEVGRELPEVRDQLNGLLEPHAAGPPPHQQLMVDMSGQPPRNTELARNKVRAKSPGRTPRSANSDNS